MDGTALGDAALGDAALGATASQDVAAIAPTAPPPVADAAGPAAPVPPSLSEDVRASLLLLATVAAFALSVVVAVVLLTSPR